MAGVLFIDGRPSGNHHFRNFTSKTTTDIPDLGHHTDIGLDIFEEHCTKEVRKYFVQTIEEHEDTDGCCHSLKNLRNLNRALAWAANKDIRWILLPCGSYGVDPDSSLGMTEAEFTAEVRKMNKLMRVFKRRNVVIFIPGPNNDAEALRESRYTWCPSPSHQCVTVVDRHGMFYDYTSKESALRMARAIMETA